MPSFDPNPYAASSASRLREARAIADSVRHNEAVHRLAMKAVFVLEDCHEAFRRMEDEAHALAANPPALP